MTRVVKIIFDNCYSDEHNILMQSMFNRLNGIDIVSRENGIYTVYGDELAFSILNHLAECDMILIEEV